MGHLKYQFVLCISGSVAGGSNSGPTTRRGFARGRAHLLPIEVNRRGITRRDHDERPEKEREKGADITEKGIAEGTKIMGLNSAGKTGGKSNER